ncbi:MAG: response regulator [Deltaproteobacteria bacterium]|nr:response regulator [Deltaproteobacteria bacterium]
MIGALDNPPVGGKDGERAMPTVLVIDGDPQLLRSTRVQLLRCAKVVLAADPDRAIELLERFHFDVVVTDFHLAGTSGLALLGEVRRRFPSVRRVLVSAGDSGGFGPALGEPTVHAFVSKPYAPGSLERAVLATTPD